jgi:hypothetical protein
VAWQIFNSVGQAIGFSPARGWNFYAADGRVQRLVRHVKDLADPESDDLHRMAGQNRFRYLNSLVQVYKGSDQTISNATNTVITFANEHFDTDTLHDNSSNTSRLTAQISGKYAVTATVEWDASGVGFRQMQFRKNGTDTFAVERRASITGTGIFCALASIVLLAASDYVELVVFQDSGGDLAVLNNVYNTFGMFYLGE